MSQNYLFLNLRLVHGKRYQGSYNNMKVCLQSIAATCNCCVAHMMQEITAEREAAHGYVSDYDGSVRGNKGKSKKYKLSLSPVSTFYTSRNNVGKGKEKQDELIPNFKIYQRNESAVKT